MARGSPRQKGAGEGKYLASQPTLLFCMSLLAPFFSSTTAASTLFTAAAQCRADLPVRGEEGGSGVGRQVRGRQSAVACPLSRTGAAGLTQVVHSIDIGVGVDEVLQHALHGQAGSQDQRGRAVVHAGIQVGGSVPDQDLDRREGLGLSKCEREAPACSGTRAWDPNPDTDAALWGQTAPGSLDTRGVGARGVGRTPPGAAGAVGPEHEREGWSLFRGREGGRKELEKSHVQTGLTPRSAQGNVSTCHRDCPGKCGQGLPPGARLNCPQSLISIKDNMSEIIRLL